MWVYFWASRKHLILWITAFYLINCIVMVYVVLRINGSSATCPIVNNQLCIMDMNLNSKWSIVVFHKGLYWDLCSFSYISYINDLTNVSSFFMPILFADDTNLFCTGTDLKESIRLVNEEISKIYDWVNANKLSLNIDKTNFMLFTPKNVSHCIDDIVINQIKIQEVKETKFLGVIIDNKLKWSAHIMYISKKIAKGIGILLKSRKVFDNDTLLSLYHTFVYPYLHYCIHVWDKAYNTHLNDLVVLQNKAMRMISGVPPRTNMDRFYVEMSILTVKRIYNYSIGVFMYKCVNKMTPDVFDNFFRNISDIHQHNTRNATQKQFYITYRGTTRGQKTFSYCGPHIWNLIITNINPNSAIGSFKKCLVSYFLLSMMMLNNSLHYAVFLLGEIFLCRLHWNLLSDKFQCGWWWVFHRNDGFSFLFFLSVYMYNLWKHFMYVCI